MNGYLDDVPVNRVNEFEEKFLEEIRAKGKDILKAISKEEKISDKTEEKLKSFLENFVKVFS